MAARRLRLDAGPVVIGEVAQAHDGSVGAAHAFIDVIADAGADAVKFQTHIAAAESTPAEPWRVQFSEQDATRYDYWRRMEFTEEQWASLRGHAEERELVFLSSPFSPEAVELLERVGVGAWKVASGEVSNEPLLRRLGSSGLPVLLSSGMSPWAELDAAVGAVRDAGAGELVVMQATSRYPTTPEDAGLNLIGELAARYACPTGISDHSGTIFPGLAAIALGATVVEVHVALHRRQFGPDTAASVTPGELAELVRGARYVGAALAAPVDKDDSAGQLEDTRELFTRSIVARRPLAAGTVLAEEDLALKKPGGGLPPSALPDLLGRTLVGDLATDQALTDADVS